MSTDMTVSNERKIELEVKNKKKVNTKNTIKLQQ